MRDGKGNLEERTKIKVRKDRTEWFPYYGLWRGFVNSNNPEVSYICSEELSLSELVIKMYHLTTFIPIFYGLIKLGQLSPNLP